MSFIIANDWMFTLIIVGIVFTISYMWSDRVIAFLYEKSLGNRAYIIKRLEDMLIPVKTKNITAIMLLLSFGLGGVIVIALWPKITLGLAIGSIITVIGWTVPRYIVDYLFEKRVATFTDQMVDGMTIMANGINSGLSVQQSIERVVTNMKGPISEEFGLVSAQVKLGQSLEEALNNLGTRVPSPEVQMFVTSVNILNETGKGLAPTFTTIMETIRERQKIQKKIEALTAQGLMQGIIISLVPFILMGILVMVDPGYIKPLFTTTLGIIFLFVMLSLQLIGGLVIRKIVKIKV